MLLTKEYYDAMSFFDRTNKHLRLDKEPRELWKKGHVYENGETNEMWKQFLAGYAHGKAIHSVADNVSPLTPGEALWLINQTRVLPPHLTPKAKWRERKAKVIEKLQNIVDM